LGVGQIGVVNGDFHRPTGATANENRKNSQSNQAFYRLLSIALFRNTPFFFFRQTLRVCLNIHRSSAVGDSGCARGGELPGRDPRASHAHSSRAVS
jgi:hypothetical protein